MTRADFNLRALYDALDDQRQARDLTWAAVTREINRLEINETRGGHAIATSTITGLESRSVAEGDGVLQMLLWLGRTPESFVPGVAEGDAERFRLRAPPRDQILRFDTTALHAALDAQRQARRLTWKAVGQEVGGVSAAMLTGLARGGRTFFPAVMRIVGWLGEPATRFARPVARRA
jgi:hypothetical protein